MAAPFISVCIPSFQRVEYLERLLTSIRQQTYGHFEVVLSDDSPDDSVKDLLKKYTDLPIRYFHNIPAAGTPMNWNLAIEKAKGDWIKIMHDDDWFSSPGSLERFANEALESKSLFLFSILKVHTGGRKRTSAQSYRGRNKSTTYRSILPYL